MIPDVPTTDNTITHVVAVGAIVSPLWLHTLSDAATVALPILGCGWLLIQAAVYIYETFFKKPKA
jgi:hypothetical protein